MSSFQDFNEFRAGIVELQDKSKTHLGFCLRVIVNEKPLNLEKTTSSVLLLINAFGKLPNNKKVTWLKQHK